MCDVQGLLSVSTNPGLMLQPLLSNELPCELLSLETMHRWILCEQQPTHRHSLLHSSNPHTVTHSCTPATHTLSLTPALQQPTLCHSLLHSLHQVLFSPEYMYIYM